MKLVCLFLLMKGQQAREGNKGEVSVTSVIYIL